MQYQHILFGADTPSIPVITVNRPDKLNALSGAVVLELKDAFERIAADRTIRARNPHRGRRKGLRRGRRYQRTGGALAGRSARLRAARPARLPPAGNLRQARRWRR